MRKLELIPSIERAYRRTGADLPGGDPRPTHGAQMEGWFWRFTDAARGRVVVALCGINRHPSGDWATVAIAVHPGNTVRSAAIDGPHASAESFVVTVPGVLDADDRSVCVELADLRVQLELSDLVQWPLKLGAGGVFSALPFLGQYWHPHVLGGHATGEVSVGGEVWRLDGADIYAEKNWGAGFPDWWWWGQAQGFADRGLCVAFGGGRLAAGPIGANVTGCVLRWGSRVIRFAPPTAIVRASIAGGAWAVTARKPGWHLSIEADGSGNQPVVLPVPLPAERRNVDQDFEHLAGNMRLKVSRRGSLVIDDQSAWAALEVGATGLDHAASLGAQVGAFTAADKPAHTALQ